MPRLHDEAQGAVKLLMFNIMESREVNFSLNFYSFSFHDTESHWLIMY